MLFSDGMEMCGCVKADSRFDASAHFHIMTFFPDAVLSAGTVGLTNHQENLRTYNFTIFRQTHFVLRIFSVYYHIF